MWEWFSSYAKSNGIMPVDTTIWGSQITTGVYTGYIGVGDLNFFRSHRVAQLAHAFNEDGRVYLARWSDQTYYVLLLALFEHHSAVGDVGINWPTDVWCHKCGRGHQDSLNSLNRGPEPS